MIQQETVFAPVGTTRTITTDETEFANAFYEVAGRAGLDVEVEVLEGAPHLTHRLTFVCGDDDLICGLYQSAHTCVEHWFWREMRGVEDAMAEAEATLKAA